MNRLVIPSALAALAVSIAAGVQSTEPASGPTSEAPVGQSNLPDPEMCCRVAPPVETTAAPAIESRIDVVFALDTTGSMGGLIEGAKQKIWAIANAIATAEPRPRIRLGLVAYRDRGDDYVTRRTELTGDLDAVYAELMAYTAAGGGDGPESVNQALNEAVTQMAWEGGDDVLRLLYLVGDAEPHMDYEQDIPYLDSCRLAAERGITIHSIQCGSNDRAAEVWREVAARAEGSFFCIGQDGGVQAVATPYDDELQRLGSELSGTVVRYGSVEEQHVAERRGEVAAKIGLVASDEALADRAVYNNSEAGWSNVVGTKDLVDDFRAGRVDLETIPAKELPEELQEMSAPEREAYLAKEEGRRQQLRSEIDELGKRRNAYQQEQLAELGDGDDSFDGKVLESLRKDAAKKGIRIGADEGPETKESKERKAVGGDS